MNYRNLGKHGLKISEISLGTMFYGSYISKEMALKCLEEAVNQGINYIDSADRYGIFDSELEFEKRMRAETIVGEFLRNHDREDLVLSSKVWYKMRESENSGGLSRKHLREGIKNSLRYLQTDYLDLFFCHRPDPSTPLEETILTMSSLIDEGLMHYWGTSWWPPSLIERTIGVAKEVGGYPPHVEQPPYAMIARFIEPEVLDIARYHGMGLTTFEALAGGFLTGKYIDGVPKDSRSVTTGSPSKERMEQYKEMMQKLLELTKEIEIPMNHLAIAWTLRHPEISSSIMGASKPEQVVSNAFASDVTLTQDILDRVEEILENKPVSKFK